MSTEHGASYGDTLIRTDADRPVIPLRLVHAQTDVDLPRLQMMLVRLLSIPTPHATP